MVIILEVRMQVIKYLELPYSFDPKLPMSVQLKAERLKLFPQTNKDKMLNLRNIKKYPDIDTPEFPLLAEACDFLDINFAVLNSKKATKYTGPNYDLFALVYYFRRRNIYTLVFMQKYIFTERNVENYSRHIQHFIAQEKYINLFTYLDSLQ
jgi:hypothetical protein